VQDQMFPRITSVTGQRAESRRKALELKQPRVRPWDYARPEHQYQLAQTTRAELADSVQSWRLNRRSLD
jgi:hypothetical protein